jgi:uncharacterized MnhB-related membrane protein
MTSERDILKVGAALASLVTLRDPDAVRAYILSLEPELCQELLVVVFTAPDVVTAAIAGTGMSAEELYDASQELLFRLEEGQDG